MIPTDVRIKENELYQEVELFIGNIKVGEAEVEVTKHMLSRFVIYEPYQNKGYGTAITEAIKALEQISHLTDRPCSVCEFHKEDGCSKWECVFEGSESE